MDKPLTIFPKSAAFVKPAESAFHNPALGKNYESMKLIPLYNFHFRAADGFDGFRELFARISSVSHDFLQQIQIIGRVTTAGKHADGAVAVGHVGCRNQNGMGQSQNIDAYMPLDSCFFLPASYPFSSAVSAF